MHEIPPSHSSQHLSISKEILDFILLEWDEILLFQGAHSGLLFCLIVMHELRKELQPMR
ncbi:hypothetical protein BCV72DRAFT_229751 [Rhizopus microsporus var. microsporus]|uniref:Uncharacterized protein n=1 Tax=Rhizopus microsporus var. microsporus TaxID=86635 RepID=A0A1X0R0D2_RHIZD|nr:hypothetical protein BCV72DRAFT_229751 [Rhizopus microsporus var. microsporus]